MLNCMSLPLCYIKHMQNTLQSMRHWFGVLSSAIPYFALGWVLLDVWRHPLDWDSGRWIPFAVGLLVLEFILIHSGVFMTMLAARQNTAKRAMLFIALTGFYSLFVIGVSASIGSTELIWIFVSVLLGRAVGLFTQLDENPQRILKRSGISMFLYIIAAFASVLLPIPELGVTQDILNQVYASRGGGVWEREPQRAIAMASAYFFAMGGVEVFVFGLRGSQTVRQSVS